MLKCPEMFNSTLFQRLWMNLPAVPQGKHTEHPRGQRGKPRGGICKTDGEGGERTTFRTRNRRQSRCCDAARTPGSPDDTRTPAPSPRCIVLLPSGRVLHPQPPAAQERHTPPRRRPSPRAGLRAARRERGPHSNRWLSAGSGLRGLIQSAGIVPPQRPAPNSGSTAGPPPTPRKPRDTPPQRGAQGFFSAATRITIPEEEVPRLLVALPHRVG